MRAMLLKLPHVAETEAWSTYVLFWAADKSIGGKLFAMMNPVNETNGVITYAAGPERYAELLEREGVSHGRDELRLSKLVRAQLG